MLAYDGEMKYWDDGDGYTIAILDHPTAMDIKYLHNRGVKVALVYGSGEDAVRDGIEAYQTARALGVGKETTLFVEIDEEMEKIDWYYSTWAGIVYGNGFTPGLLARGKVLDEMVEKGYRGVWWQSDSGEISSNAWLYSYTENTSEVRQQFPVWGPQNIPLC